MLSAHFSSQRFNNKFILKYVQFYFTIKKICKPTNVYNFRVLSTHISCQRFNNKFILKYVQFYLTIKKIFKPTNFLFYTFRVLSTHISCPTFSIIYTKVHVTLSYHDCKPINTKSNLYLPILGTDYVVVTCMHVATASAATIDKLT